MYFLEVLTIQIKFENFYLECYLYVLPVAERNPFCSKTLENNDFANLGGVCATS